MFQIFGGDRAKIRASSQRLLKYLSLTSKSDREAIETFYTNNPGHYWIESAIEMIDAGSETGEALFEIDYLSLPEKELFINGGKQATSLILELREAEAESSGTAASTWKFWVGLVAIIFLVCGFYTDELRQTYITLISIEMTRSGYTSIKPDDIAVPFYLIYWWSWMIFTILLLMSVYGIMQFGSYIYNFHTQAYYKISKQRRYEDARLFLYQLLAFSKAQRVIEGIERLSQSPSNGFYGSFLDSLLLSIQKGENYETFFMECKSPLPTEVEEALIDAQNTHDYSSCLNTGIKACDSIIHDLMQKRAQMFQYGEMILTFALSIGVLMLTM
jgi:hypothetical protein